MIYYLIHFIRQSPNPLLMRLCMMHRSLRILCLIPCLCLCASLARAQNAEAPPTSTPDPAQKEMEWDAGIGLSNYNSEMKDHCWYPVWIEIRANKTDVKGVATISQANNPLRVEVPVEVVKGSRKRYRTYFQPFAPPQMMSQTAVTVQLEAQSVGSNSFPIPLRFAESGDRHILVLCEQDGAFNFLNRRGERDGTQVLGRQSVIYSRTDLIPDDTVALDSLDAMIIDTPQVRRLSATQWSAIRGWIAQGGQLLLGAGRQQPFIEQSPLKSPFGVAISPAEPVAAGNIFGNPGQTTQSLEETLLVSWPAAPAGGWNTIWVGDAMHPFLAGKRIGRGWFGLCASALDPPVLERLRNQSGIGASALACIEQPATQSPLEEFASAMEHDLGMSLQRGFAINLATIGWVLLYLALYNALAMPVNWWICRKIGHPGLAWPILILMAIGFAWYGYRYSMERQQQNFQVNEITFISRPAEDSSAQAVSLTTLFTPRRINSDMAATGIEFLNRLALTERDNETPLTLGFDQAVTARRVLMYPWTVFNVRGEYSLLIEGGVKTAEPILTGPSNIWRGLGPLTLTNQTSHTFTRWWLRRGNVVWPGEGGLEAGQTRQVSGLACEKTAFQPGNMVFPALDAIFNNEPRPTGAPPLPQTANYVPSPPKYPPYGMPGTPGNNQRRSRRVAADDRLYFIGEATGICSPFSQPFASQKQVGCIFYEQVLPHRDAADESKGPWQPGDWAARVTRIGSDAVDTLDGAPANDSKNASIFFPLNSVVVEFTPLRRRNPAQPAGMIDIAYRFASHPDQNRSWSDGKTAMRYRMLGCPVQAFNFKRKAWETLQATSRGTLTLAPAEDYLKPMESAFFLRLNASPNAVCFIQLNRNTTGYNTILTGKQLFESRFGVQMPLSLSDMQNAQQSGYYAYDSNRPPVAAQLLELKVRQYETPRP